MQDSEDLFYVSKFQEKSNTIQEILEYVGGFSVNI